jgi:hypothetical protein
MAFEQLKAEIAMLVQQMEDEPEDVHELHARIRQKLAELKATGQPLPDDLTALERRLDSEERASMRARASSADQQPAAAPSRRQTAGRSRRAAAKKKAPPAKKAKRPAARKSAAASRPSAAKRGRRGAAKAKRSTARKAKRSSRRGRR